MKDTPSLDITRDIQAAAEAYQRLLDVAAEADVSEAIRQGLDDLAHGRTRPVREAFDDFRRRHAILR